MVTADHYYPMTEGALMIFLQSGSGNYYHLLENEPTTLAFGSLPDDPHLHATLNTNSKLVPRKISGSQKPSPFELWRKNLSL